MILRLTLAALAFAAFAFTAQAEEALPPPVNGITFEEWAAGNARLANNQTLADILKTLNVDEAQWKQADAAFLQAFKERDPGSYTFTRYGEVFSDPAVGRFKGLGDQPEVKGKFATFEDYARVQAHLSVAVQAGVDPQEVLKEHGLTVYEFSQEAGNWVKEMGRAAGGEEGAGAIERMNRVRENFEAEYRARYKLDTNEKF